VYYAIKSALWYWGHWNSIWCTVCLVQPHSHRGRISGILIDASHALSPITSVRRRNNAVASAFVRSLYSGTVGFPHGVFHVVSVRFLAFSCHRRRHSRSAHFAIRVVSRHRCWCPPVRWRRSACALPAFRWLRLRGFIAASCSVRSFWCARNPCISFSRSFARTLSASIGTSGRFIFLRLFTNVF